MSERVDVPIAWLDERLTLMMVTPPLESLIGRDRAALLGRTWREVLAPPELARQSDASLREGLKGSRGAAELVVQGRDGDQLALSCGLQVLGLGKSRKALAVEVRRARRVDGCAPYLGLPGDARYLIRSGAEFGTVIAYRSSDPLEKPEAIVGRPCHLAVHGLEQPCAGCPARPSLAPQQMHASLLLRRGQRGEFLYRAAIGLPDGTIEVDAHALPAMAFDQMVAASVADRAEGAALSARERAVLDLVAGGASQKDIAEALGIALGTVKFHQGNLLRKLGISGAESLPRALLAPATRGPDRASRAKRARARKTS